MNLENQMRLFLTLFSSMISFLISINAFAGAVSAGGMQSNPKLECLFLAPEQPLAPLNFIIFDLGASANPAELRHFDFQTNEAQDVFNSDDLTETSSVGLVTYRGKDKSRDLELQVDIVVSESLSSEDYMKPFQSLVGIPKVSFDTETVGYRSSITVAGRKVDGICAKGYFFFYFE